METEHTFGRYYFDPRRWMYEDELPEMTDAEYAAWFDLSTVDGVRVGPLVICRSDSADWR